MSFVGLSEIVALVDELILPLLVRSAEGSTNARLYPLLMRQYSGVAACGRLGARSEKRPIAIHR